MARYSNGWIKDHRKQLNSDIYDNPYLAAMWGFLKLAAVRTETKILWEGKQRVMGPGSVLMGLKELAERWNCSRKTIHKWLHYLEETERISLETGTRGCLVTIRNWDKFQGADDDEVTTREHEVNAKETPSKHEVALNREVKKERKEEIYIQEPFELVPKEKKTGKPLHILAQLWNAHCGDWPKVDKCEKKRLSHAMARWNENPNELYWISIIGKLCNWSWAFNTKNDGWVPNFDYLIRPDTHTRAVEGQFPEGRKPMSSADETERIVRMITDATA